MEQQPQLNDQNKQEYPPMHTEEDTALNNILQKVPSTAEILFYKQQNSNINIQWINWAIDMFQAGYETENIIILAGEDIYCNPFEFTALTDKIFEELHLNHIDIDKTLIAYSTFLIQQAIQSPNKNKICDILKKLEYLCISNDYNTNLYDFYALSNAIDEMEECGRQYYWNDSSFTKDNWYEYVLEYFKQYISGTSLRHKIIEEDNSISKKVNSDSMEKCSFKKIFRFFAGKFNFKTNYTIMKRHSNLHQK